jgi:hypothetical protein
LKVGVACLETHFLGTTSLCCLALFARPVPCRTLQECFPQYRNAAILKDKKAEATIVPELRAWIEREIHLDLTNAPFDPQDETLMPKAGACARCPKRTGNNLEISVGFRIDLGAVAALLITTESRSYVANSSIRILSLDDSIALTIRRPQKLPRNHRMQGLKGGTSYRENLEKMVGMAILELTNSG